MTEDILDDVTPNSGPKRGRTAKPKAPRVRHNHAEENRALRTRVDTAVRLLKRCIGDGLTADLIAVAIETLEGA